MPRLFIEEYTRALTGKTVCIACREGILRDNFKAVIDDIVGSDVGLCFGPDTLAEARNRGYTLATPGAQRRHRKPRA